MNIAFLIGNGFDLNLGLKTRYEHFYKYYCGKKSKNAVIERFKEAINDTNYDWSDLELALGEYTSTFAYNREDDFVELLDDIQDSLAEYLDMQTESLSVPKAAAQKFEEYVGNIEKYLTPADAESLTAYRNMMIDKSNNIDFIVFNYTDTVERLALWKGMPVTTLDGKTLINSIEHVHGTTKSNMILGVNDETQIANQAFADSNVILEAMKKQEMNINTETNRAERCQSIIDNSDFICIFGMSLGATDKCWWQHIVRHLNTSMASAAIFAKMGEVSALRMYRAGAKKRNIKYKLLDNLPLSNEDAENLSNRIYVSLNSGMFDNLGVGRIMKESSDNIAEMAKRLLDMANDSNTQKKNKDPKAM